MAHEDRSPRWGRQPAGSRLLESAGSDPGLVLLDGLHALKHALRFGAEVLEAATLDAAALSRLAAELAPDVAARVAELAREVPADTFRALSPSRHPTGVVAVARRPDVSAADALDAPGSAPVVLLDRPRHHGNIGAAVRVAAAAGAAGVLVTGDSDPWHPAALRGSAGLHYALPVVHLPGGWAAARDVIRGATAAIIQPAARSGGDRPLVAVHPDGEPLHAGLLPRRAIAVFGSERHGLDPGIVDEAGLVVGIPMRSGVSSLNLATAVAVVLYTPPAP